VDYLQKAVAVYQTVVTALTVSQHNFAADLHASQTIVYNLQQKMASVDATANIM
jgi:hypothetical protein